MSLTNNEKFETLLTDDEFLTQVSKQQTKDQIFMGIVISIMGTMASLIIYLTVI